MIIIITTIITITIIFLGINASLMALKECIRAKAAGKNASHQYRKSKLTMALKASFLFPTSRTLVIATVSPASKDTEHSLNTLRHACIMDGQQSEDPTSTSTSTDKDQNKDKGKEQNNGQNEEKDKDKEKGKSHIKEKETRFITGGTILREECGVVDVTEIARKNMAEKKKTGIVADARTSNGNEVHGGTNHEIQGPEMTEKQIAKNRRASERTMYAKLNVHCKEVLTNSRARLGNDLRQQLRLKRGRVEYIEQGEIMNGGVSGGVRDGVPSSSSSSCLNRYGGSGVQSMVPVPLEVVVVVTVVAVVMSVVVVVVMSSLKRRTQEFHLRN